MTKEESMEYKTNEWHSAEDFPAMCEYANTNNMAIEWEGEVTASRVRLADPKVMAWDGNLYYPGDVPEKPAEVAAEELRRARAAAYALEADPMKLAYDEARARGSADAEPLRDTWLAKKDEIRKRYPY
jgi:hypothetical protein